MTKKCLLCNFAQEECEQLNSMRKVFCIFCQLLPRDSFESIMKMPYRRKGKISFQATTECTSTEGKHQLLIFCRGKPEKRKKKTFST